MASWIIHFRIADGVIADLNLKTDIGYFVVGNIAPDCGIPCENGYNPPSQVTHITKDKNKSGCNYQYIYENFIKGESDIKKKSFYLGYYVHLITDVLWSEFAIRPLDEERKNYGKDYKEFFKKVKSDWYNLDFKYFHSDKRPASYEVFKKFGDFNEPYPEFYKNNEINRQIENIVNFYENNFCPADKIFKYMTPESADKFVAMAVRRIVYDLRNKKLL